MISIYYLRHHSNHRRLRYYHTLAGARIAQRQRNRRLGFVDRVERVEIDNLEYERCLVDGRIVDATWVIEEDHIESPDLLAES